MKTLITIIKVEYDEDGPDPINTFAWDELFDRAANVEVIDVEERDGDEGRYRIVTTPDATNRLAEARDVLGNRMVALADDANAGQIIGYVRDDTATGIAVRLTREPV
jgi:hypothetical protein